MPIMHHPLFQDQPDGLPSVYAAASSRNPAGIHKVTKDLLGEFVAEDIIYGSLYT